MFLVFRVLEVGSWFYCAVFKFSTLHIFNNSTLGGSKMSLLPVSHVSIISRTILKLGSLHTTVTFSTTHSHPFDQQNTFKDLYFSSSTLDKVCHRAHYHFPVRGTHANSAATQKDVFVDFMRPDLFDGCHHLCSFRRVLPAEKKEVSHRLPISTVTVFVHSSQPS